MNEKAGNDQIKKLMQQVRERYQTETGKKLGDNWNTIHYTDLAEKLDKISEQLPVRYPNRFKEHFEISDTQVRDAYMREKKVLRPHFHAAVNIYLFDTIDPVPEPEPKPEPLQDIKKDAEEVTTNEPGPEIVEGQQPEFPTQLITGITEATPPEPNIIYEKVGIIGLIAADALAILLVVLSIIFWSDSSVSPVLTETFNIIVLFSFFLIIKSKKLNFGKESDVRALAETLNIDDQGTETVRFNIDRVNKITSQLCEKTRWFIIFLLLFYVLNLIEDLNPKFFERYSNGRLIMDFFENVTNAISAAFLYFGFKILYDKTLDEKNNNRDYYMGTLLFLLIFTLSYYFFLLFASDNSVEQAKISNYYNLVCGIYNGWAMILLFGRLISMEYFFKDIQLSTYKFSRQFFHYGAVFILPIYGLANCLYGVQEFKEFIGLKSIIFLICFVGKGFFLLFIFHYINFKWLHIYIHLILANNRIPRNIINLINRSGNT